MSDENQIASGEPNQPLVTDDEEKAIKESNQDSVQRDTYLRTLGQKKKLQSENELLRTKVADFEKSKQEQHETKLQEEQRWQEFAKEKEKAAAEALERVSQYEQRDIYQTKIAKVISSVDGLTAKYHDLINVDSIRMDESGEIDGESLNAEIERIKTRYPEILQKPKNSSFPGNAPQPNGNASLSVNEYARLSKDDKKKRVAEMSNAPDWMKNKF